MESVGLSGIPISQAGNTQSQRDVYSGYNRDGDGSSQSDFSFLEFNTQGSQLEHGGNYISIVVTRFLCIL